MVILRGRLDPEAGALLLRALDAARETLYQRTRVADPGLAPPTRAQQQADALGLLAESALHHELDPGAPGERYQVVVHVDAAVLTDPEAPGQSELEELGHVPAGTSRRLACDASRVVMRHDEHGRAVEIGARIRTIPPALRRALCHRDRTCRFPGCEVRVGQGHHLHHWAQGGPTILSRDVTPPMVFVSTRTRRALPGTGSASISAGRSTCLTRPRFRGNAETAGVVPSAPPARGGLPAQASVSTALPGYLRAIRSAATCAISVHERSTLMCGASWPAATRSARRRRPIAAGSLPNSAKI